MIASTEFEIQPFSYTLYTKNLYQSWGIVVTHGA